MGVQRSPCPANIQFTNDCYTVKHAEKFHTQSEDYRPGRNLTAHIIRQDAVEYRTNIYEKHE